ncbi:MAG TPA: trypsin-like serine protease [Streptosporangiaceae bacterium]|nr:trypsin-like serine protease [Streptosporangiaceae bacterium]
MIVSGTVRARIALRAAALGTAALAALTGCSSTAGSRLPGPGYWTAQRLRGAQPWRAARHSGLPEPRSTPSPRENVRALRVGALFDSDNSGNHFCTASVVDSPEHNLLITAAHCVNAGNGTASRTNVVFIPDYSNGDSPHGVWTPARYVLDPRWQNGADPDFDVAFVLLKPLNGSNIQDVTGANKIAFGTGYQHLVRVTGYPSSASAPIACENWTSQQSPTQLKFACANYTGGTSGSPWVTRFDPATRTGTIIGVIGGYQEGGNTADVSYCAYLGSDIQKLYKQATQS